MKESTLQRGYRVLRQRGFRYFILKSIDLIMSNLDVQARMVWAHSFHRAWYYSHLDYSVRWFGIRLLQNPMDMWVLQEILWETKPDFVIETGTFEGGSSLFFAHMFDLLGHGNVITIDIRNGSPAQHPRVKRLTGSSVSEDTLLEVKRIVGDATSMVFLDSLHGKSHVLQEMEFYHRLVKKGHYLVVADTNLNGHPVIYPFIDEGSKGKLEGGPMEAVREFLASHHEFHADKSRERLFTFFPNGFLQRDG